MRILQICSARYIGGGERHVAGLSNELSVRGHDVFAVVAPGSPLTAELTSIPASHIEALPLRNALDLMSAVKVARFAAENGVELIHAHIAKDYLIAAAAARIAKVPYVITRHVLFPMSRSHRRLLSKASFVIALSNAIAERLRKDAIFPEDKIVTIRYGVDITRYPEVSRAPRDGFRIGTIGNLDPIKGMDVFIRAAAIVVAERDDVEFEIVGDDRDRSGENEKQLRRLVSELGLENKVSFVGWSDDVRSRLLNIDVFVSASRSESFGAAIAEAMLSGIPVVATETEGAKEIISDRSLGRLVPIDSPGAIADSILALLQDPDEQLRLGRNGRSHIVQHFSLERMVSETVALYGRAIS